MRVDSEKKTLDSQFTELVGQQKISMARRSSIRGNIIKAHQVRGTGTEKVEIAGSSLDQPKVLIHSTGEEIHGVEFCCTCGKTATVQFTYEGE